MKIIWNGNDEETCRNDDNITSIVLYNGNEYDITPKQYILLKGKLGSEVFAKETKPMEEPRKEIHEIADLNNDGVIDKEDVKIAAKVLRTVGKGLKTGLKKGAKKKVIK